VTLADNTRLGQFALSKSSLPERAAAIAFDAVVRIIDT
jgi:hypothetical protein